MPRRKTGYQAQLFPNEKPDISKINGDYFMSNKLDGVRAIFRDGHMLTREGKEIPNKQLQERFQHLKDWSLKNDTILDGEIYCHGMIFNDITSYVMTQDLDSKEAVNKHLEPILPECMMFYCFDALNEEYPGFTPAERHHMIPQGMKYMVIVKQEWVRIKDGMVLQDDGSYKPLQEYVDTALENGYEGKILKKANSKYKFGRITPKSGDGYKLKKFITLDCVIIEVIQGTKAKEGSERKINELGYSETSKKKEDRETVAKASAFRVRCNDVIFKATISEIDEKKKEIWANKESYIGRHVEIEATATGAKDKPRFPHTIRFREDLDYDRGLEK